MDTSCPSCGEALAGRYLGVVQPRCPNCSAYLVHNSHPSELRTGVIEPAMYVFALIGFVLAAVFAGGHGVIAALIIVAWLSFAVVWIFRAHGSVPESWPRWRLAEGQVKHGAPGGNRHAK